MLPPPETALVSATPQAEGAGLKGIGVQNSCPKSTSHNHAA